MRSPVQLGRPEEVPKIEAALKRPIQKRWQRQRLQAMQMAAQGQWTLQQIGDAVEAGRSTVAVWLKLVRTQGVAALLARKEGQGAPSKLTDQIQAAIQTGLAEGRWRRARDLQAVAGAGARDRDGVERRLLLSGKSRRRLESSAQDARQKRRGSG